MSKKVLQIINDVREWNRLWEKYDQHFKIEGGKPITANKLAKNLSEHYNIKDDE